MSSGCLSAGKDNSDNLFLGCGGVLALYKGDLLLAVGVGEQCLDLILIGYALSCFTLADSDVGDAVPEHSGKLGNVLISCFLKL